jgi:subtilisin family serine protease
MIPRPWKLLLLGTGLVLATHLGPEPGSDQPRAAATPPLQAAETERERASQFRLLGADRWHQAGQQGQGIKVAVIDCGFKGYQEQLGRALPAQVVTRSFRADGSLEARDSFHGILCAEVIHALAPRAELLFLTWEPNQPDQFIQAVQWARTQGARIISCSVVMPSWSDGEGGGLIHQALARVLGPGGNAGDLLFFASAGNMARRHWSGDYRPLPRGWHAWEADRTGNPVRPWREAVSVEMYWPSGCQYELQVYDVVSGEAVGQAASSHQPGRCFAVVRLEAQADRRYAARVRLLDGQPQPFHLVSLGADLDYSSERGSIPFPGDGPAVLAVGAVDERGRRISYSSCGPNSKQPKPDLAAPVPFPSRWREQPFTGTSAAAPQAAALAALCWCRHPQWTAQQVRQTLNSWARDVGDPGHDIETGHGMVRLPRLD